MHSTISIFQDESVETQEVRRHAQWQNCHAHSGWKHSHLMPKFTELSAQAECVVLSSPTYLPSMISFSPLAQLDGVYIPSPLNTISQFLIPEIVANCPGHASRVSMAFFSWNVVIFSVGDRAICLNAFQEGKFIVVYNVLLWSQNCVLRRVLYCRNNFW